jgi:membrane protein DedA with SNARE-associated domain
MEQQVLQWITQYGYVAIFCLLMFGIVGLPVPDETLLTFCGYLIYRGNLSLPMAFAVGLAGSISGITLSYWLGRTFGIALIHRYGKYLRITEEHLQKAHAFFEKAGHWGLTFGYFVPGVRHFTAYAAGMSDLEPHKFALFAYSGACIWVSTFLALGYFLGERWTAVEPQLEHYATLLTIGAAALIIAWLAWRRLRKKSRAQ